MCKLVSNEPNVLAENSNLTEKLNATSSDIVIGGLRHGQSYPGYIFTPPYLSDELTWCIRAAHKAPGWLMIFLQYDGVWAFMIPFFVFLITTAIFFFYAAIEGTHHDFIQCGILTFCIALAMPASYRPALNTTKCFFCFGQIGAAMYSIMFLSVFTSFVSVPLKHRQIKTVKELIDHDFQLIGSEAVLESLRDMQKVILNEDFWPRDSRKLIKFLPADSRRIPWYQLPHMLALGWLPWAHITTEARRHIHVKAIHFE